MSIYILVSTSLVFAYLLSFQLTPPLSLFRFWSGRVACVWAFTEMCIWVKFRNRWNKIWIFIFKNYLLFKLLVLKDLVYFSLWCWKIIIIVELLYLIGFDLTCQLLRFINALWRPCMLIRWKHCKYAAIVTCLNLLIGFREWQ